MVPRGHKPGRRVLLDGNFARRKLPLAASEYCIWDTELPGFGLRVRPTGRYYWFVRLRHRGKHRRITLGCTDDVDAVLARTQARRLLAEVALDGLPKRTVVKATPILTDFVETYWGDIARHWKPSTQKRNLGAWKRELLPTFGAIRVADIVPADVLRWRDSLAGGREVTFNRTLPVLASLLKYAEQLRLRRKGSNPCRGMSRYKRPPCERYLTPLEYRRIGAALRDAEASSPGEVAIVRLLLYTGARISEIRDLRWEWVKPPHLTLPDSKTGRKTIWLNSQALAVLDEVPKHEGCSLVFPNRRGTGSLAFQSWWERFRRRCQSNWHSFPRADSCARMTNSKAKSDNPFRYFNSSPEVIRLVVMMYVRYPLSLRNVEDLLFERGIDISHETVRMWWNRFGPMFAADIRRQRVSRMRGYRQWRWHLDEMYVKLGGEMVYLWRAVDQEGEVLESFVTRTRDKAAALTFMKKALKRHGSPETITTDGLRSYRAAMKGLGNAEKQQIGRWANNRVENSHLPFRRRERAMLRFRQMKSLQKFASVHGSIHNHFNQERHLVDRQTYKTRRSAALAEWQILMG